MTNWGSHGAGSDHETKTPLIAWGAGVKIEDKQKDVQQIDIAPLLSALIGVNYPINSLGRLPDDYIDSSQDNLSEMIISNVLQLMEIFNIKKYRRMDNAVRFVPFQGVTTEDLETTVTHLRRLITLQKYDLFKVEAKKFVTFLLEGADYYHNYYQLPVLISVTVGIVAWIVYLATYNVTPTKPIHSEKTAKYLHLILFLPLYLSTLVLLKIQSLPLMFYVYFIFPIFMVQTLARRYVYLVEVLRQLKNSDLKHTLSHGLVFAIGLRLLVQAFHNREVLSIVMYIVAGSVIYSKSLRENTTKRQKLTWICCCVVLSCFPLLPVMKTTFNTTSYLVGYILWWLAVEKVIMSQLEPHTSNKFIRWQHVMLILTPLYTLAVEFNMVAPDSPLKYFAWIWAFVPIFAVALAPTQLFARVTSVFLGFGTFYLMVTSNYESLFFSVLRIFVVRLDDSREQLFRQQSGPDSR
jgi:phosphatidylinositol glycan class N